MKQNLVPLTGRPAISFPGSIGGEALYVKDEVARFELELPLLRIPAPGSLSRMSPGKKSHQVAVLSRNSWFGVFSQVGPISFQVQGKERNLIGCREG